MPPYHPTFLNGETVEIAEAAELERFREGVWPYHNALTNEQLDFGGEKVANCFDTVCPIGFLNFEVTLAVSQNCSTLQKPNLASFYRKMFPDSAD